MQILPSLDRFKVHARQSGLVPVWREFLFDVDTAVTVVRDRESATMPMGWAEPSVTKVDRVLTGIAEAGSVAYGTVMKGLFCSRRDPD